MTPPHDMRPSLIHMEDYTLLALIEKAVSAQIPEELLHPGVWCLRKERMYNFLHPTPTLDLSELFTLLVVFQILHATMASSNVRKQTLAH